MPPWRLFVEAGAARFVLPVADAAVTTVAQVAGALRMRRVPWCLARSASRQTCLPHPGAADAAVSTGCVDRARTGARTGGAPAQP